MKCLPQDVIEAGGRISKAVKADKASNDRVRVSAMPSGSIVGNGGEMLPVWQQRPHGKQLSSGQRNQVQEL